MKKTLLCIISALMMAFCLGACSSAEEPDTSQSDFEAFMEVQKNMENVKDMAFKLDMETSVPSDDGDYNLTMSGTGKEIQKAKDDVQMEVEYSMNMSGTDMSGTMYMKDQTLYMEMMGQKMKMDASDEMGAMMNVNTNELFSLTEDMISDLKVTEEGEDTIFSFALDPEKALDYFAKNASGAEGITDAGEDVTFDKMDVTVTAGKDKMAKKIAMDFAIQTKADEEDLTMEYKVTMEYVSINTDLTIDFPDFSEYEEVSV